MPKRLESRICLTLRIVKLKILASIVVPTFNRSHEVRRLLEDILRQTESNFEVLIVDDGSDSANLAQYRKLIAEFGDRFLFVEKSQNDTGRGPGASRNRGIRMARGTYVLFCDDDDRWIREDHLAFGCHALDHSDADLFWADMQTATNGEVLNPSMYGGFSFLRSNQIAGLEDTFDVDRKSMSRFLRHRIIHCDSLVVRRSILDSASLYWEPLKYAEDHDFCFRLADKAKKSLYRNLPVAELNVAPHISVARSMDSVDRLLFGVLALKHIEIVVVDEGLISAARANQSWKLVELGEVLSGAKNKGAIRRLFKDSFFLNPSIRGFALLIKAFLKR